MTSETPTSQIVAGAAIILAIFTLGAVLGVRHEAKTASERGFMIYDGAIYDVRPRHE